MRAIRLSDWAAIRVSGPDAQDFLQGQLSSDLRKLTARSAQRSSWNSPKGRMLAVLLLVRDEQGTIDLWMPADLIDPLLKRLRLFVLRSRVRLEDGREHRAVLGLVGPEAQRWLAAHALPAPHETLETETAGELQVLRMEGVAPRYLLCGTPEALRALAPEAGPDTAQTWRAAQIEAGVPVVFAQTQDRWVAQMANLDLLGGIGFDKGCYTGQEVIARLHYLGNLKKRMFLLRGAGPAPAPGTEVFDARADLQAVGDIVDAVADADGGGFVASAVLQLSRRASDSLRLAAVDGPVLSRPEPYAGLDD